MMLRSFMPSSTGVVLWARRRLLPPARVPRCLSILAPSRRCLRQPTAAPTTVAVLAAGPQRCPRSACGLFAHLCARTGLLDTWLRAARPPLGACLIVRRKGKEEHGYAACSPHTHTRLLRVRTLSVDTRPRCGSIREHRSVCRDFCEVAFCMHRKRKEENWLAHEAHEVGRTESELVVSHEI